MTPGPSSTTTLLGQGGPLTSKQSWTGTQVSWDSVSCSHTRGRGLSEPGAQGEQRAYLAAERPTSVSWEGRDRQAYGSEIRVHTLDVMVPQDWEGTLARFGTEPGPASMTSDPNVVHLGPRALRPVSLGGAWLRPGGRQPCGPGAGMCDPISSHRIALVRVAGGAVRVRNAPAGSFCLFPLPEAPVLGCAESAGTC